jgi:hypothetical protein
MELSSSASCGSSLDGELRSFARKFVVDDQPGIDTLGQNDADHLLLRGFVLGGRFHLVRPSWWSESL